jgi:CRISPR system Cascade subunit CasA
MLVDRGGRREGRIATAELLARAAALDYVSATWSVRQRIRRSIDAHVTWTRQAAVADELVAARQRQFDTLQRRVAAGEIARNELELVRASLADALRVRTAARSAATRAWLELAAAIGVPPEAIDVSELATFSLDDIAALPPVASEARSAALEGRPEILQAMLTYDQAETNLRLAVASQYPEVRLGPGYTWERGLAKLPFGLSLTFPNRDFSKAAIAAAEARRAEAGRGVEAAVNRVIAGINNADADYRAAVALLDLVRSETLPTAIALAAQADREFAAGSIDRAGWAAAQAGAQTARLDEIVAIRGVLEAETGLEDALRRPLRGPDMAVGITMTTVQGEVVQ